MGKLTGPEILMDKAYDWPSTLHSFSQAILVVTFYTHSISGSESLSGCPGAQLKRGWSWDLNPGRPQKLGL